MDRQPIQKFVSGLPPVTDGHRLGKQLRRASRLPVVDVQAGVWGGQVYIALTFQDPATADGEARRLADIAENETGIATDVQVEDGAHHIYFAAVRV